MPELIELRRQMLRFARLFPLAPARNERRQIAKSLRKLLENKALPADHSTTEMIPMQKFFFDMKDGVPMQDQIGIEFNTTAEAIVHCKDLAQHWRDGSLRDDKDIEISMVNSLGREIHCEFCLPRFSLLKTRNTVWSDNQNKRVVEMAAAGAFGARASVALNRSVIRAAFSVGIVSLLLSCGTALAQDRCLVADPTSTALNVRTDPNGRVVEALRNGVVLTILELTLDHGKTWAYVARAGEGSPIGWVYRDYLDCRVTMPSSAANAPIIRSPSAEKNTPRSVAEIARVLGDVLLPVTENADDWMVRVAAVPVQEQQFCRIVDRFYSDIADARRARNEIRKNFLYKERLQDLATLLPKGSVENWVVRIKEITEAPDGSAAVVLQPPCRAMLGSDVCKRGGAPIQATIRPENTMFRELAKLSAGDFVIVSGRILYGQNFNPDQPLPTYALFEAGSYCSAVEGGAQEDVFVTEINYLVGIR